MIAEELLLARKASLGDHEAFENIYRAYYKQILWHVTRIVGNRLDAEDLTQEVFLKAYQFMGTYSGQANLGRWLRRIATNTCIDQMRKKSLPTVAWPTVQSKDGDEQMVDFPDDALSPHEMAESNEGESAILEEINRLPEYYRKVVVLYDVMEKSGEEVAREASCPIGTVKSRLSRAHKILRDAFESREIRATRAGA
ncbi:MAG TPA: RNA polymerase sigma factor [Firmicutes bacterium]|nr:RNA polymerase sigma factor [Candidatus Fermentithermobacillaceae bacterium]